MARAKATLATILRQLNLQGTESPSNRISWAKAQAYSSQTRPLYRYTRDNTLLTPLQRQFYEDNGFLVIKKLVPEQLLDRYINRFIDICEGRVKVPFLTVMKDISLKNATNLKGQDIVNKLQDFVTDDVLFEYCCLPQIVQYVECFTGQNMTAMHTMLINKPPDSGSLSSRHPLHQDLNYFPFRPADSIVCSWTAMENVNRQNGCLVAVPGSHKGELLEHGYPQWEGGVNKLYHGIMNFSEDLPRVYLEMEKGDTVFFHPILIHGSGANRTTGYRKAISCHYADSNCEYIDVGGTIQEQLGKEILGVAKKRGFEFENYADVWRARARVVKGIRSKL